VTHGPIIEEKIAHVIAGGATSDLIEHVRRIRTTCRQFQQLLCIDAAVTCLLAVLQRPVSSRHPTTAVAYWSKVLALLPAGWPWCLSEGWIDWLGGESVDSRKA
jgi:hypothetical protein